MFTRQLLEGTEDVNRLPSRVQHGADWPPPAGRPADDSCSEHYIMPRLVCVCGLCVDSD